MIHPDTILRYIDDDIGLGVFATAPIPKGTIVYVKDALEIEIPPESHLLSDPRYNKLIETYSYTEPFGARVISWDNAKYINHCCESNTISTGYGFEIAITDIEEGEQITDDYGALNPSCSMALRCDNLTCRREVRTDDLDKYYQEWDQKIKDSLRYAKMVEQPLWNYMDTPTILQLEKYLRTGRKYQSVFNLKYRPLYNVS